jgi:hypothetical protein
MSPHCRECGDQLHPIIMRSGYQMRYRGRLVFDCRTCDRAVMLRAPEHPSGDDDKTRSAGEHR